MSTQRSPMPWKYPADDDDGTIKDANGETVCVLHPTDDYWHKTCGSKCRREREEEDGPLIAAAPELLKTCKEFLAIFENGTHYDTRNPYTRPEVKSAIAAIAKAEGRDVE
jgi:hypothetical protein